MAVAFSQALAISSRRLKTPSSNKNEVVDEAVVFVNRVCVKRVSGCG